MVYLTFFNLSEFSNKKFMIWATISCHSYFYWLYRASLSFAAKNIINLILILTIWWCPCVESSLVFLEEVFAMTSAFSWQNSIILCPASFCATFCRLQCICSMYEVIHCSPVCNNKNCEQKIGLNTVTYPVNGTLQNCWKINQLYMKDSDQSHIVYQNYIVKSR